MGQRDADIGSGPARFQKGDLVWSSNINLVLTNRAPKANRRSFHHLKSRVETLHAEQINHPVRGLQPGCCCAGSSGASPQAAAAKETSAARAGRPAGRK